MYMMFLFLLFMMFSPNPPGSYRLVALEALAAREKQSLDILRNATYGGAFEIPRGLNITGVRIYHEFADDRQTLQSQNILDGMLIHFFLNHMKKSSLTMPISPAL
jgi:hypothetical protein